ncbi:MAG: alpha/beta hydrolase domain-containing protein [Vicinamibacterales bacterium]
MQPHARRLILSALLVVGLTAPAWADVTRVAIASRTVVANGVWFGAAGPYEKIAGTVFFELDPAEPHNAAIADIALAPRNARGRVEFSSDFFILAPQDPARASGSVLFEVSNRGGKGLLTTFNRATASPDPMQPEHFGDGLLMQRGFTLVWVGWEFDVGQLSVKPPLATRNGAVLVETIAAQAVVDARAAEVSFSDVPLYPPLDPNDETATLTVRDKVWDRPTALPRRSWQFVPPSANAGGRCAGAAKCPRIAMASGFEPGRIYEVKYRAVNPPVAGVGMAAIRDFASAMKYGGDVPAHGKYLHIYGASQSGRFLRQYLYDGFNADEKGRKVFDGVMPHIAGAGRGDFNTRFSQAVGLDQYAALKFPFTDAPERDPATGRTDALLGKYQGADLAPRIIYTNSSVEYWGTGRAAALIHTSIDGTTDLPLPANVRAYLVAGSQHGPAQFPPRAGRDADGPNSRGTGQQLPNPTPHTIALRAFVLALDRWVRDGVEPPASQYPHVSDGTLTPIARLAWPSLPGVTSPAGIPEPRRARGDGPEGTWPFLVPQVDEDGNERGGIRLPDVAVPLGTSTGWNFRNPATGNPTAIVPLLGSFIPFARTSADRTATDPRRSVAERYASRQDYLGRVTEVTLDLVKQGYVLREDAIFLLDRAAATWDWMAARTATPTAPR